MSSTKKSLLKRLFGTKDAVLEAPPDEATIQAWLVERLAKHFETSPEQINVNETFSNYGLDSRTAVGLSGELEKWLGRRLPATLVWDYPTIALMAKSLTDGSDLNGTAPPESTLPTREEPVESRRES
jgi:acyl carrier protein